MSVKKFQRHLKKGKLIELYHVIIRPPVHKDRTLKVSDEVNTETAFDMLKERHKGDIELTKILEEHKDNFRTRLPSGLPALVNRH